jgi:hypothetical protein
MFFGGNILSYKRTNMLADIFNIYHIVSLGCFILFIL